MKRPSIGGTASSMHLFAVQPPGHIAIAGTFQDDLNQSLHRVLLKSRLRFGRGHLDGFMAVAGHHDLEWLAPDDFCHAK